MCSARAISIPNSGPRILRTHTGMNTVCISLDSERPCNIASRWSQCDLYFQYLAKWPLILIDADCNYVVLVHPFNYNADADIAKSILRSKLTAMLKLISVVAYSYFPEVTHAYKFEVEIGCAYQRAGRRMLAARAYLHYKWDRYAKGLAHELNVKWPTLDSYVGIAQSSSVHNAKVVPGEHVVLAGPKVVPLQPVLLACWCPGTSEPPSKAFVAAASIYACARTHQVPLQSANI